MRWWAKPRRRSRACSGPTQPLRPPRLGDRLRRHRSGVCGGGGGINILPLKRPLIADGRQERKQTELIELEVASIVVVEVDEVRVEPPGTLPFFDREKPPAW